VTCYNLGVRRDTSADVLARWHDEVRRRLPPDHPEYDPRVVFSFGVNDTAADGCGARVRPHVSLDNARQVLGAARRAYPVLFVGPPPVATPQHNERIAALSSQLAGVCRSLDVPYLAVFDPLAASRVWMDEVASGDGSHPGAAGYAALAQLVTAWEAWRRWLA
jgi:lysophospholipase L1-like esterase